MMDMETLIITHLLHDEQYMRKVLPFLNDEYFTNASERMIVSQINTFVETYGTTPSVEALTILIQKEPNIKEEEYKQVISILDQCQAKTPTNLDFMIKE